MRTSPAAVQRDQGLRRVSLLTRWVAGTSAAAAGLFTLLAAHPKLPKLPPLRLAHTSADAGAPSSSLSNSSSGDDSAGQGSLNPPSQAPSPAYSPPQVVSGSS